MPPAAPSTATFLLDVDMSRVVALVEALRSADENMSVRAVGRSGGVSSIPYPAFRGGQREAMMAMARGEG